MSKIKLMCRGSTRLNRSTCQVSSASSIKVWLVYEKIRVHKPQAVSQSNWCSSNRSRISSGTANAGCVSLR